MMRIISGEHKGRKINLPSGFNARPTTDFARENIFNVLNNHYNLEDVRFLDLFSGSGAFSLEMMSRKCKDITAVEINAKQVNQIEKNAAELEEEIINIYNSNAISFLEKVQEEYHIIFADPPFDTEFYNEIYDLVFSRNLLRPGGLLVLEHDGNHDFSDKKNFLEIRTYGKVCFSIFEKEYNI